MYTDFKLDLNAALSLLEEELTDDEFWELYVLIVTMGACQEALGRLCSLARARNSTEAIAFLGEVEGRVHASL